MNKRTELLKDLKERLVFLKEIGIDALDADLTEIRASEPGHEVAHTDRETYIPSDEELKRAVSQDKASGPQQRPAQRKSEILNSVRLSGRSRSPLAEPEPEMPKPERKEKRIETAGAMESASEALFEDLSPGLPETGESLSDIHAEIGPDCERCRLCEKRTQVVNSVGNPNADLMFIGEAPGADEDEQGEPFVGRAGQLLTKIIEAIDLKREDVFIGNINRCRPPDNRRPMADEASVCKPFLLREISVVRPKVIVVLGNTACQNLLDTNTGITRLRGKFLDYFGVKVMPTFHPAYLLRDPRKKREVWEDMKLVREELNKASRDTRSP